MQAIYQNNKWGIKTETHLTQLSIAGIRNIVGRNKLLLDRPQAHKSRQQVSAASLVIGTASPGTTKWLLANDGTSALAVDVKVSSSVAESALGEVHSLTVLGKHRSSQTVFTGLVDLLADLAKVGLSGVVVGVDDQDRAEEFTGEKSVVGVGSAVDGRLDVPALGGVVGATGQQLEFGVLLGFLNDLGELVEGRLMDDRTAEVGKVGWLANLDLLDLVDNLLDELIGN